MQPVLEPQQAYQAYLDGNLSPLARLLDEQVIWHVQGRDGVTLTITGRRDVLQHLLKRPSNAATRGRRGPALLGDRIEAYRLDDERVAECWERCEALGTLAGVRTGELAPPNVTRPAAPRIPSGDARAISLPQRLPRTRVLSGLFEHRLPRQGG